jgi:hypothetical protein
MRASRVKKIGPLAALHESGSGTSETSRRDPSKSAYGVKAVVQRTSSEDRI